MNAALREALDRTLLLMRDELVDTAPDELLQAALTETSVALVADAANLVSHSAQSSYITAALLMARSGHKVHLVAPDVPLIGPQPPLQPGGLVSSLLGVGRDLLPGIEFSVELPYKKIDLEVKFGDSMSKVWAERAISVGATPWSASLQSSGSAARWTDVHWPFGGMAAGALSSVEAFKAAMQKLRPFARNTEHFDARLAGTDSVDFELAPAFAPTPTDLGLFDFVSAGAITNGVLFALARIIGVTGIGRVVDNDLGDLSNLNRYALLLRSMIEGCKASTLASMDLSGLQLKPVPIRYDRQRATTIGPLAPRVLIGVDDIPARWEVQKAMPKWLGIGATTHWSSMASFHVDGLGCAGCLHPTDDKSNAPIPTVAFVSFWAGLLLATYFVRVVGGESLPVDHQYTYLTSLRPELPWYSPVAKRQECPVEAHSLV
jgi:hypothetical protein